MMHGRKIVTCDTSIIYSFLHSPSSGCKIRPEYFQLMEMLVMCPGSITLGFLLLTVRPDMRYCFRSGRCRPNPRTKHISIPPRHMTKSYIQGFTMISQHYTY